MQRGANISIKLKRLLMFIHDSMLISNSKRPICLYFQNTLTLSSLGHYLSKCSAPLESAESLQSETVGRFRISDRRKIDIDMNLPIPRNDSTCLLRCCSSPMDTPRRPRPTSRHSHSGTARDRRRRRYRQCRQKLLNAASLGCKDDIIDVGCESRCIVVFSVRDIQI